MAPATPGHGGDPSAGALRTGLEGEGESWCVGTGGGGLRTSERGGDSGGGDSGGDAEDLRPGFGPLSPEIGAAAPSKTSMEWPRPCSTVDLDDDIWEQNKYECDFYPVAVDCSETIYNGTQQSCILDKGKGIVSGHTIPVEVLDSDEDGCMFDVGDYSNAGHSTAVAEEQELINKLKRQRNEVEDPEGIIVLDKLTQMKKQRQNPDLHIEGDTDVEELYSEEEESDAEEESGAEEVAEQDSISSKKLVVRQGPTSRSHHEVEEPEGYNFVPSADELGSPDDLGSSDDDGFVRPFVLPSGNKRKVKKTKKRNWYDPDMAYPEEQFAIKLCFRDVYEFRVALRNYHIAQLRNYQFHRNSPKRVIVKCTEKGCPFYITASSVGKEKTFCLRKIKALHTCIPPGENTKVSIKWLASQSEQAIRTDPNTRVDTLLDNAKLKFGVEVPRSKAYRARKQAFAAVIGDQEKQYTRLRDYLQAIIDTNPGSRCIVTTKELVENPSRNPQFHGLFICLNASKEGFLNGCRPFIGVLKKLFEPSKNGSRDDNPGDYLDVSANIKPLDRCHSEMTLECISGSDGKEGIAKAATLLCSTHLNGDICDSVYTETDMGSALNSVGCGGPEPDLLLVYGPARCHLGFPAWRLRYTEIMHMGPLKSMKYGAIVKAFYNFSKKYQNYGK